MVRAHASRLGVPVALAMVGSRVTASQLEVLGPNSRFVLRNQEQFTWPIYGLHLAELASRRLVPSGEWPGRGAQRLRQD